MYCCCLLFFLPGKYVSRSGRFRETNFTQDNETRWNGGKGMMTVNPRTVSNEGWCSAYTMKQRKLGCRTRVVGGIGERLLKFAWIDHDCLAAEWATTREIIRNPCASRAIELPFAISIFLGPTDDNDPRGQKRIIFVNRRREPDEIALIFIKNNEKLRNKRTETVNQRIRFAVSIRHNKMNK